MSTEAIDIVGGSAHGAKTGMPSTASVNVPTKDGGMFQYTLRRCKTEAGMTVYVLAPAGRPIDPKYLTSNKLRN